MIQTSKKREENEKNKIESDNKNSEKLQHQIKQLEKSNKHIAEEKK